jgi:hypothetical protein
MSVLTWTEARVAQLHQLHADHGNSEIAHRLGISKRAVDARIGREYRAGTLRQKHPEQSRPWKPRFVPPPAAPLPRLAIKPSAPSFIASLLLPIAPARSCLWPMWPHQQRAPQPPVYCGAAVKLGCSYCGPHARMAFDARPPRPPFVGPLLATGR